MLDATNGVTITVYNSPVESWIEKWGINLDWEAKAALKKAVALEIELTLATGIVPMKLGKEGTCA